LQPGAKPAAEASIAEQITIGRTLRQVAAHKSVSINTVKSHPKSIFFKMDIRSQADLIRVVLGVGTGEFLLTVKNPGSSHGAEVREEKARSGLS
jgi:DNA-binding CsgD family transcriptional regulator